MSTPNAIESALSHLGARILMLSEAPWDEEVPGCVLWVTETSAVAKASEDGLEYGVHGYSWLDQDLHRGTVVLTSGEYTTDKHKACKAYAERCAYAASGAVFSNLRART